MTHHLCIRYKSITLPSSFTYFPSIKESMKNILYTKCQTTKTSDLHERNRTTQTPTCTRSFNKLSSKEKRQPYKHHNKKYLLVNIKYKRMVCYSAPTPLEGSPYIRIRFPPDFLSFSLSLLPRVMYAY